MSAGTTLESGMRVSVFDHRLYRDDQSTPLAVTMQPAVIVRRYRKQGSELVDVRFDRDGMVSKGHFANMVKHLVLDSSVSADEIGNVLETMRGVDINLVSDPFIPVLMRDKSHRKVSLSQAFEQAENIFTIDGPMHVRASVVSLLAGISQVTQGAFEQTEWSVRRSRIIPDVVAYLEKNKHLFDLHGAKPFLQQPLIVDFKRRPGGYLDLERPSGDKTIHFDHDAVGFCPDDQAAALDLLVMQYFRSGCIYRQRDPWTKELIPSNQQPPLTNRLVVVVEGDCLLDTIWYHTFPRDRLGNLKVDKPFWERTFGCRADYEQYCKESYFGCLLPVPFAVYLHKSGEISESETLSVSKGQKSLWKQARHPMVIDFQIKDVKKSPRKKSKESKLYFQSLNDRQEVWRQLGATLAAIGKDRRGFVWAMRPAEQGQGNIYLYVGGVVSVGEGIYGFPESVFCIEKIMRTDGDQQRWVDTYVNLFGEAAYYLSVLKKGIELYSAVLKNASRDKARVMFTQAERMYWSRMSLHRATAWDVSGSPDQVLEKVRKWTGLCRGESLRVYDTLTEIRPGNSAEAYGRGRSAWKDDSNE